MPWATKPPASTTSSLMTGTGSPDHEAGHQGCGDLPPRHAGCLLLQLDAEDRPGISVTVRAQPQQHAGAGITQGSTGTPDCGESAQGVQRYRGGKCEGKRNSADSGEGTI